MNIIPQEAQIVQDAYTALFNQIQSYPPALRDAWWSGARRTLDHRTTAEIIDAIRVYGEMADKAYQRHVERHGQS